MQARMWPASQRHRAPGIPSRAPVVEDITKLHTYAREQTMVVVCEAVVPTQHCSVRMCVRISLILVKPNPNLHCTILKIDKVKNLILNFILSFNSLYFMQTKGPNPNLQCTQRSLPVRDIYFEYT